MNDSQNMMTAALKRAIQSESDGYHFYLMASRNTEDAKAREAFQLLAEEELLHARFLRHEYQAFLETGKPDDKATIGPKRDLSGPSPIFSPGFRERIKEAHFEVSALSIGMQLELDSERFYREQARSSADASLKKFFGELADWEAGHYRVLKQQMDDIKEDYWNQGGFAPF